MSRAECLRFARGFYPGKVAGRVQDVLLPHAPERSFGRLCMVTHNDKIVGSGFGWPLAYANMLANLPRVGNATNWAALDAMAQVAS